MQTFSRQTISAVLAVASGLWVLVGAAGCDEIERELDRRCRESERIYQQELAAEQTELADRENLPEDDDRPTHFGVTLSNDLLSDLANVAVEPLVKGALQIVSSVEVDGKSVDLRTTGDIVKLTLEADEACDHCFRVGADLGGGLVADIPGVGTKTASLDGTAQLVVPLMLTRGDDKSTAVKLDLAQLGSIGASRIVARINGISRDWENKLRRPLSDLILEVLKRKLEPVTLVEFDGPSFGLEGFEVAPVQLESDAANGSVFAGFSTNIDALNTDDIAGVQPVTGLADGQNIALSFQPKLVGRLLSLLIGHGDVARRYTRDGEATDGGDLHVTLETFTAGDAATPVAPDAGPAPPDAARGGADSGSPDAGMPDATMVDAGGADAGGPRPRSLPVGLEFQMHNFKQDSFCFSAGARMTGGVAVRNGELDIGVRDVRFTSSTAPAGLVDIANWTTAQFIQESRTLVDKSLDGDNLTVPGTTLSVGPLDVGLRPHTVVLRGSTEMAADETK